MKRTAALTALGFLYPALLLAQFAPQYPPAKTGAPPAPVAVAATPAPSAASAPVADPLLAQVEQAAQTARQDLAQIRIDKWKAGSDGKAQFEQQATALQRNLTAALPEIVSQARAHPQDLAASFKLYRNLNALCEVLVPLADAAGGIAPQSDYQALADAVSALDRVRRSYGDHFATMAADRDTELAKLRTQLQASAAPPASKKKTVIDDTTPAKKSKSRKKPAPAPSSQ